MYEPGGLHELFRQVHGWLVEIISTILLAAAAVRLLMSDLKNLKKMFPRKGKQRAKDKEA